jgi:uncharacterized protein (TIGR03437 family)
MKRKMKNLLHMFSLALGITSAAFGQGGTYTTIDFPGATSTLAWSINKGGDIAGSYTLAGVTHAFRLTGGRFTTIDYPAATSTDARGINDRGDMSGIARDAAGVFHGFLLSADKFTALDFPNASSTQAWGLNSSDDVVGNYTLAGVSHGFKWSGGQFTTIDFPGSTATNLTGINALSEISGIYNGAGGLAHAFLFSDGEFTSLDVPQSTYTNSTALTSHGDVIGRYMAGTVASGYLLREGVYSTIAFPGAAFTGSASMNGRGDIVGRYQTADSTTAFHAFLLNGFQSACVAYNPRVALASGAAAVTHASDFKLVTAANPAAAGELLSLFAAGLGPTLPGVDFGKPFPSGSLAAVTSPVEVRVNGTPAEVLGAVGLPGTVDGFQVNFRMPADTLKGLASLQLSAGTAADTSVKVMVK